MDPAHVQANFEFLLQFFKGKFQIDDTTGVITQPLQPAFMARADDGTAATSLTLTNITQTIPFADEAYDVGGNFSTSTYKFVAPVTGTYAFSFIAKVSTSTGSGSCSVTLRTPTDTYIQSFPLANVTGSYVVTLTAYPSLTAGDEVYCEGFTSLGAVGTASVVFLGTYFTGLLVN
jgi:hypothetical protein